MINFNWEELRHFVTERRVTSYLGAYIILPCPALKDINAIFKVVGLTITFRIIPFRLGSWRLWLCLLLLFVLVRRTQQFILLLL